MHMMGKGLNMTRRRFFQALAAVVTVVCLLVLSGVLSAQGNSENAFERAREVQALHTARLMAKEGVVGTAIGLGDAGNPALLVLLEHGGVAGIPNDLDGVQVVPLVTGRIEALKPPGGGGGNGKGGSGGSGGKTLKPTSTWPRPVPIGVSTGNAGECSAGTISCRVTDGTHVYALSNNHVYALENDAAIDSEVVQPGLYDTRCRYSADNVIGTLADFNTIYFDGTENTIDAAIALTSTADLGKSTPPNGYGTPKSTPTAPLLDMAVQKYGRTTGLTHGTVVAIDGIVNVTYSSGTALFVNQIIVTPGSFIRAGDSGSLMVTDPGRNPVGLLFAGSSLMAVANPIGPVLDYFDVTIDGE
jgi:hypothetical protein